MDESSLTGETEARVKGVERCAGAGAGAEGTAGTSGATALADRTCVAYMGTLVRNGEYGLSRWNERTSPDALRL